MKERESSVKYETVRKVVGEEFVKQAGKTMYARKFLEHDFLNEHGYLHLEVIMALLYKFEAIQYSPMLVHTAALLLIYLKPEEVYAVLQILLSKSRVALNSGEGAALIRWHFTLDKSQHFKLLSTFVKSYLATTFKKKRSLLAHMNKIGFDFNQYVERSFKSMSTAFLPLAVSMDIMLMFLVEGVKIVFRYTYAVMSHHKRFIKNQCHDPSSVLTLLSQQG